MLDFRGQIISTVTTTRGQITMQVKTVCSSPFASYCVIDATDDDNFGIYLESIVQISLTSTCRRAAINHDKLAKHWGIHPNCAKAMVECTTQQGVRTIANPALSCWFCTNNHMSWYQCLCHPMFTDTMFFDMYSRCNNKWAQVFTSDFGWVRLYTMKTKGKAHEALSMMSQCEGVLSTMVMDGSNEHTLGRFSQKIVDAHSQLKQAEL